MGALAAVCQSSSSLASYPSRFALLSRLLVSKGGRGVTRRWISSSGAPIRFQGGRTFQEDPAQCAFHSDRRRRKMVGRLFSVKGAGWTESESPYDVLGVERDVNDDGVKAAYRRLAKIFHPDVYDGSTQLLEGETAEARFIKIQAAYELLMDRDERRQYDLDHRSNPLKASKSWMEWVIKKKKAFDQRGDMAVSAWAEQQQMNMNLKVRRLSRHKMDPEEERRILSREKQANVANFETTVRRHGLVLKKRDIMKKKQDEEDKKKLVKQLLAAEGLELDDDRF